MSDPGASSLDAPRIEYLLERLGALTAGRGVVDRWISVDASRFAVSVSEGPLVLASEGIRVHSVSDVQLLAMKLDAMRDDVDRNDAIVVAARLGFARNSTELCIAPYIQPSRYRRACEELDDIWEEVEHARR